MHISLRCRTRDALRVSLALLLGCLATLSDALEGRAQEHTSGIQVSGELAVHALMSLTDGHLQKMADVLTMVAATDAARSGEWEGIRRVLPDAARITVPAVHWFALPDGSYWTLELGRAAGNLSERAYFSHVLEGETVIGALVVSKATSRNTAIVAVPVRANDGRVTGVIGASIHLDSLSAHIRRELGDPGDDLFFFAIDDHPLGAIHSDPALIFTEPMELGDEGMREAFRRILSGTEGMVDYEFRGRGRTVQYVRSPVTNWWYGVGRVNR